MTQTVAHTNGHEPPPIPPKPHTDAAAVKWNAEALSHAHERALEIIAHPEEHKPRLVTSDHVRGSSWLDKIADAVNDRHARQANRHSGHGAQDPCCRRGRVSGRRLTRDCAGGGPIIAREGAPRKNVS
jgi:hypothetical protein